jgi:ADP-ribosylglycohydrolase
MTQRTVTGKTPLLGAVAGDVIGSVFESSPTKRLDFPLFDTRSRFTDDTVLTLAIADAILDQGEYAAYLRRWGRRYPDAGYGGSFGNWLLSNHAGAYNSWGNGSAMRVSAVGWAFDTVGQVLDEAERSAAVTHNHVQGIKGAQAVALGVYLARAGTDKRQMKTEIETRFGYDLDRQLPLIRPTYRFDVSCQGSVPEAFIAFLASTDFESAVRNAVSLGATATRWPVSPGPSPRVSMDMSLTPYCVA